MGIVEYCKMFVTIVPGCGIRAGYTGRYIFVYPAPKKKTLPFLIIQKWQRLPFFVINSASAFPHRCGLLRRRTLYSS